MTTSHPHVKVEQQFMKTKLRKLKTGSPRWLKQLKETVISECCDLIECNTCGRVTRGGYVCIHCGENNPGNNVINPQDWL